MFPDMTEDDAGAKMTEQQVRVEMAAVGHTVVEVRKENGRWTYVQGSPFNRRIHVGTEMLVAGPAAGHELLKTKADPTGTKVLGTSYNCAGGVTPWGTILTCEEGLSDIFGGDPSSLPEELRLLHDRYGYDGSDYYGRGRVEARFRLDEEPHEPNRFDWVVEIDPYDPASAPIKRTALGRTSHEGATVVVNQDGRVVVYMGDDDYFEHIYRFVSAKPFDPANRAANRGLLDEGTLSVARFADDGTLVWEKLVHGEGKLTAENGFRDQGELLVKTRFAAAAVDATRMDRPEGFKANPVTGRVYAVMTKNAKREPGDAEPRQPARQERLGPHPRADPAGHGQGRRPRRRRLPVGHPAPRRRPCRPRRGREIQPRHQQGRLAGHPRQYRLRPQGPGLDLHRRGQRLRPRRRRLCLRHRGRRPGADPPVLRLPVGGRGHRRLLHAGRAGPVRLGPAPGRELGDTGQPHHPLADHGPEAAADAGRGGIRQARRWGDRRLRLG